MRLDDYLFITLINTGEKKKRRGKKNMKWEKDNKVQISFRYIEKHSLFSRFQSKHVVNELWKHLVDQLDVEPQSASR